MRSLAERMSARTAVVLVATAAILVALAVNLGTQLFVDLLVAGLTFGSIAALSGLGLVVTFRATGVFNFAHGAIAVFIAYILWQLTQQWGVPLLLSAPLTLLVVGPLLGALLERTVFRPLSERDASTAENLVATIGVFVVLVGAATAIFGQDVKTNPVELYPTDALCFGGCGEGASGFAVRLGLDQLLIMATLLVAAAGLYWLFNRTRLGVQIKAVVDRRELAQLTAVDANRVSMIAWSIGAGFAGLTGVLLAPVATGTLDSFRLTLVVIETFAVAVVARLTSLPRAVAAGLGIGVAASYLQTFSFAYPVNWVHDGLDAVLPLDVPEFDSLANSLSSALDQLVPSIFVLVFLGALLFMRSLDVADTGGSQAGSFVARISAAGARGKLSTENAVTVLIVAVVAVALPFVLRTDLSLIADAQTMLGLAIIFLSIVVVTGYSGHISLAQAGFAGIGALAAARVHNLGVPVIPSMIIGGLVCVPIGLGAGYPALKRRGLFLALTTLALGLVLERAVLQNLYFIGSSSSTTFDAPNLFGLDLGGDVAFYFYELVVLVLMILFARNLRRSRLGRILGAMRDSETGARSIGLNLRTYKLFIFASAAFMAGVGGALLSQGKGTYSGEDFVTINGLLWFAVVVVAGVGSIYGALLGAFLFTLLDSLLGGAGVSILIVGLAAVSLGRLPGGLVGGIKRLATDGPALLLPKGALVPPPDDRPVLHPSRFAVDDLGVDPNEDGHSRDVPSESEVVA